MIGYPAGSESSDDVEVSSGGELEPLLTLAFSKSGSLGDEGSKNSGIDQRCSLLCAAGRGWMRTSALGLEVEPGLPLPKNRAPFTGLEGP